MVVPARCCCDCLYFYDNFTRTEEEGPLQIDPDGINVLGETRYVLENPGDWEVDIMTGTLVCNAAGSLLKFYDDTAKVWNVSVDGTLTTAGDYFAICFGSYSVKVEGIDGTTIRYTAVTDVGTFTRDETIAGYPVGPALACRFFKQSQYPDFFDGIVPTPDTDVVQVPTSDCGDLSKINIGSGWTVWGLKASADMVLDNLSVTYAKPACQSIGLACQHLCWTELPETLTLTLSGLGDRYQWCQFDVSTEAECGLDCVADWIDCMNAAGTDCAAQCLCHQEKDNCEILCMNTYGSCKLQNKCSELNGEYVLEKLPCPGGGPCLYRYVLEDVEFGDPENDDCDATTTYDFVFNAYVQFNYFDSETRKIHMGIAVQLPLSPPADFWEAGIETNFDSTTNEWFCNGETITLSSSSPAYADEVLLAPGVIDGYPGTASLACAPGGNISAGRSLPTECYDTADPPNLFLCEEINETTPCTGASHDLVEISDVESSGAP